MVMMISAPLAAAAAVVAARPPLLASASSAAFAKSKPVTSCSALSRFAAMGPPILPRPMKPMRMGFPPSCRSIEAELALAHAVKITRHLVVAHRFEGAVLPAWPVVLVDQQRADALEEIMARHHVLRHAVFESQRLFDAHAAAECELAKGDLEAEGRGARNGRERLFRPRRALLPQRGDDCLDRATGKGAVDRRSKCRQARLASVSGKPRKHRFDLSGRIPF